MGKADVEVHLPSVDLEVDASKSKSGFKMPKLDINLPKFEVGVKGESGGVDASLPKGKLDVDVSLPQANMNVEVPTTEVDIHLPSVEVNVDAKKKSKFGMKMPKFDINLPKFDVDFKGDAGQDSDDNDKKKLKFEAQLPKAEIDLYIGSRE